MKVKKDYNKEIYSNDPFYDLFFGGYLDPEEFIEDYEDIKKIYDAMNIISYYFNLLEENGIIEEN